jgi:hypothetical protein
LRQVVVQRRLGEEEVELCLGRRRPPARDEVRRAADPTSLVREVAVADEAAQPVGDLLPAEFRAELRVADERDGLGAGTPPVELAQLGDVLHVGRAREQAPGQHEIRARERERVIGGVVEASVADRDVGPDGKRAGGERCDQGERDREPPPEPASCDDPPHAPRSSR